MADDDEIILTHSKDSNEQIFKKKPQKYLLTVGVTAFITLKKLMLIYQNLRHCCFANYS